jgi:hypothetical protein
MFTSQQRLSWDVISCSMARLLFCIGAFTNVVWRVYIITRLWSCECLLFVVLISCPRATSESFLFYNKPLSFAHHKHWTRVLDVNILRTWWGTHWEHDVNILRTWWGTHLKHQNLKKSKRLTFPQSTREVSLLGACCIASPHWPNKNFYSYICWSLIFLH